jgi:hypothetical protein
MRLANHIYAALALSATAICYSSPSQKSKVTAVEQNCLPEPPWCIATECDGNVSSLGPALPFPPAHQTDPSPLPQDDTFRCLAPGALHGCQCCPRSSLNCEDEDCRGLSRGRCQSDKLKGCPCCILRGPIEGYCARPVSEEAIERTARSIVQEFLGGDLSRIPGYEYHGLSK